MRQPIEHNASPDTCHGRLAEAYSLSLSQSQACHAISWWTVTGLTVGVTDARYASCIPCLHHMDVYHMHVTVAAESNAQVDHSMAES